MLAGEFAREAARHLVRCLARRIAAYAVSVDHPPPPPHFAVQQRDTHEGEGDRHGVRQGHRIVMQDERRGGEQKDKSDARCRLSRVRRAKGAARYRCADGSTNPIARAGGQQPKRKVHIAGHHQRIAPRQQGCLGNHILVKRNVKDGFAGGSEDIERREVLAPGKAEDMPVSQRLPPHMAAPQAKISRANDISERHKPANRQRRKMQPG